MEKLGFDLDDGNVSGGGASGEARGQLSSESRRQSLERCIKSLVHSCQCRDANCRLQSCQKMKRVVSHAKSCRKKVNGGCPICKQLVAVCCYHAKCCKEDKCMVPFCNSIKARLAQQQMQAQLQSKALLQRRMAQMRSVCAAAAASSTPAAPTPTGPTSAPMAQGTQSPLTAGPASTGVRMDGGGSGGKPGMSAMSHHTSQMAQHPAGHQQPSHNVLIAVKQVHTHTHTHTGTTRLAEVSMLLCKQWKECLNHCSALFSVTLFSVSVNCSAFIKDVCAACVVYIGMLSCMCVLYC